MPTKVFSFERRHCSTNSDEGVQFKTAEAFSESAIFSLGILMIIAFFLPKVEEKIGFQSPFKLDVAVMALVFYTIGFLLKRYFLSENFGQPLWVRITQLVFTLPIVRLY